MGGSVVLRSEARVPIAKDPLERLPERSQVFEASVHLLELALRELSHLEAWRMSRVSGGEKTGQLFERESDGERPLDEKDPFERRRRVDAISVRSPRRSREESAALVVSQGVDAHAGLPGDLARTEPVRLARVRHDPAV